MGKRKAAKRKDAAAKTPEPSPVAKPGAEPDDDPTFKASNETARLLKGGNLKKDQRRVCSWLLYELSKNGSLSSALSKCRLLRGIKPVKPPPRRRITPDESDAGEAVFRKLFWAKRPKNLQLGPVSNRIMMRMLALRHSFSAQGTSQGTKEMNASNSELAFTDWEARYEKRKKPEESDLDFMVRQFKEKCHNRIKGFSQIRYLRFKWMRDNKNWFKRHKYPEALFYVVKKRLELGGHAARNQFDENLSVWLSTKRMAILRKLL